MIQVNQRRFLQHRMKAYAAAQRVQLKQMNTREGGGRKQTVEAFRSYFYRGIGLFFFFLDVFGYV